VPRVRLPDAPAPKLEAPKPAPRAPDKGGPQQRRLTIPHDIVNEQVIIAACLIDDATRAKLVSRLKPDHFFGPGHAAIWDMVSELRRRGLDYTPATARQISGGQLDISYLSRLLSANPKLPANLSHHVEMIEWDRARVEVARGSLPSLLEAFQNTATSPSTVKALARQLCVSLDGYSDRRYLRDPAELIRSQMLDIAARKLRSANAQGACWPYGIDGLDIDNETKEWRLTPGAAPSETTVITGLSGSGKSALAIRIAISMANQRRRTLFGPWEMGDGRTIELMAGFSLGYDRAQLRSGNLDDEQMLALAAEMERLSEFIRFLDMPFGRQPDPKRQDNERNLDMLHGYMADSGCEVAIFDLWHRCLRYIKPEDETLALTRQQSIHKELKVHGILCHQQGIGEGERGEVGRPTRYGVKGSKIYVEVADTMLGVFRPALYKRVEDTTIEIPILKQRDGKWPIGTEFDWNGLTGSITNGRTVPYDPPGTSSNEADEWFVKTEEAARKKERTAR
jgi:DnaB helicase-like protein